MKKTIKAQSHHVLQTQIPNDLIAAFCLLGVFIVISLLFRQFANRRQRKLKSEIRSSVPIGPDRIQPRRPWKSRLKVKTYPATEKQLRFLKTLLARQNFFRSKPITFESWIEKKTKTGFISAQFASNLIKTLKLENKNLQKEFSSLKKKPNVGIYRDEVYVSDLRTFYFCERAAYYSSHQFPSQNLIDLGAGYKVHEAYSDIERRDSSKPANVLEFIKNQEPGIESVEWLPNTAEASIRHATLPLSGRPDGIIHFSDGTKAIIELKTVTQLPDEPRISDFNQADIYALLCGRQMRIRDACFVLYMERSTNTLALYKQKRNLTEYDLAQVVSKIARGSRSMDELKVASSENQCSSCGYRAICPR